MAAITIQHAKNVTIADGTTTDIVRPSDWNSGHNVTFNLSASDISGLIFAGGELYKSTDTAGITIGEARNYISFFEPIPPLATATMTFAPAVGSYYLDPFELPDNISGGHANYFFANPAIAFGGATTLTSNVTGAYSRYQTNYHRFGLYSQQTGTDASNLTRIWSTEYQIVLSDAMTLTTGAASMSVSKTAYISMPGAYDTNGGMTYSTYSTSNTSAIVSSSTASSIVNAMVSGVANYISGSFMMPVGFTSSLGPNMYVFAYGFSSTGSSTGTNYGQGSCLGAQSVLAMSEANLQPYKSIGNTTTNISSNAIRWNGYFSTTSGSAPTSIGTNAARVSSTTANNRIYWNYDLLT